MKDLLLKYFFSLKKYPIQATNKTCIRLKIIYSIKPKDLKKV